MSANLEFGDPQINIQKYERSQQLFSSVQPTPLIQAFDQSKQIQISKTHKRITILALAFGFAMYRLLHSPDLPIQGVCIRDITHQLTEGLNKKVNEAGDFCYWFMMIGQLLIDFNILMFSIYQIFSISNFLIFAWVGLFYGIRGLLLGIYWQAPGFPPSLGVPYGITRDFFYSGHTGVILFSCFVWNLRWQTRFIKYVSMLGLPYIMLLVLSTRVHYVIDVFAGVLFAYWSFKTVVTHLQKIDRFFTRFYLVGIRFAQFLRKATRQNKTNPQIARASQAYIQM